MKDTNWLILGIIGIVFATIGPVFAFQTVMETTYFGGFSMTVPSMPYLIPGLVIGAFGGLLATVGFAVFAYKRTKRVAKEVIREAILEAEEK